jgi:NAD(P)-dependent dehydrogenase (short-subunit alcohol dehydrogenase family)
VTHAARRRAVLVTWVNRGIGQALVDEALRRGSKCVYAGTRQPSAHADGRVTLLTLDVTSATQIQAAVESVASPDLLINNAGVALYDGVTQAFVPMSASVAESWQGGAAKTLERQNSALPEAEAVKS